MVHATVEDAETRSGQPTAAWVPVCATHDVKCETHYFDAVERGDKTFEVRRDDRGFQRGDVLRLWRTRGEAYDPPGSKARSIELRITYILTGGQYGVEPGYVVLGLSQRVQPE